MEKVNWDELYYDLTNRYQCAGYDIRKRPLKKLLARRSKIKEVLDRAKELSIDYPDMGKEEFKSKLEMEFIPGLFTTILLSIFSVMVKYLIEYIIDRLYPDIECLH